MITFISSLLAMIFMRFGPDIPVRRQLNHHLVERPLAFAEGKKRHHVIFLCIAGAVLLFGGDMLLLFGPDFLLAYAADLALYLDIVVVSALVSSLSAGRAVSRSAAQRLGVMASVLPALARRAGRARRVRRGNAARKGVNDDDGGGSWALAPRLIAA